jgi:hypothetical protein
VSSSHAATASLARTASFVSTLNQAVVISGSLVLTGSISFNSSNTGSVVLDINADTFELTGSMLISGSMVMTGSIDSSDGFIGSLLGTASYATLAKTASFITLSQTASFVTLAQTASFVQQAVSSSFATTASNVNYNNVSGVSSTSTFAGTASFATTYADSGSVASRITNLVTDSSSFSTRVTDLVADSSSFSNRLSNFTGSVFGTASWAIQASTASLANTASYLLGNASASYIQFSQPATVTTQQARLQWDSGSGTLEFGLGGAGGAISTKISQDMFSIVRNVDTTTIAKGDVVYLFGASGDKPSVKKASNLSDATSAKTFGVAHESIAVNQFGIVTTVGIINALNLAAFTAGDILYLGTATGSLTNIKPQAPLHTVFVGVVNRANAGNGIMYINPQNGYELDELHDVRIISASAGQALVYSGSYWINSNELNITGSVLGTSSYALSALSSSYAITSSNSDLAKTASFVILAQTASFVTLSQTASFVSLAQTASFVQQAVSASYSNNSDSSSYAITSSYASTAGAIVSGINVSVNQLTASAIQVTNLNVVTITSSIDYASGSNIFGTKSTDTQQFTGSVLVTGSLTVNGPITGTSSYSTIAETASYAALAQTASYVLTAKTASYISWAGVDEATTDLFIGSSSYANNAATASYVTNAISSSYALTASYASNVPATSSWSIQAQTASYVANAQTASFVTLAQTASYVANAISSSYALTASYASNVPATSSWSIQAQTASYVLNAVSASYSGTASYALNGGGTALITGSTYNITSSWALNAVTSSYALTASYSLNGGGGGTASLLTGQTFYVTTPSTAFSLSQVVVDEDQILVMLNGLTQSRTSSYTVASSTLTFTSTIPSGALVDVRFLNANNMAGPAVSSSYAATASYVINGVTASYVTTAQTASFITLAQTASYVLLAQTASYVTLAQTASYIATASYALAALSASYAPNIYVLPSNVVSASAQLSNGGGTAFSNSNNLTVGQITASAISVTTLKVVTITSSIDYASGSNIFGTKSTDTQLFTGSVAITGSLTVNGAIIGTSSLASTASYFAGVSNGTTNYVTKFTGANTIGSSSIFDNGSVGIGTSSPSAKLDIGSTASAGALSGLIFSGLNSTSTKADYVKMFANVEFNVAAAEGGGYQLQVLQQGAYKNSIVASGITNNSTNYLALSTTNEAVRIISNGNVGIGTTTPGAKLSVEGGNIGIDGNNSAAQFFGAAGNVAGTNTTGGVLTVFGHAPNAFSDLTTPPYDGSNFVGAAGLIARGFSESAQYRGSLEFFTKTTSAANATSRMIITHDGNVGIGTTSPAAKLHISGTNAGIIFDRVTVDVDPSGIQGSIYVKENGISNYEAMLFRATGYRWQSDAGTDYMLINSSGNVGIGTTSPAVKLDVSASANQTSQFISSGNYSFLRIGHTGTGAANWDFYTGVGSGTSTFGIANSGGTRLAIDSSGNVGIGTASPAYKLHISGGSDNRIQIDATSTQGFYFTKAGVDNGTHRVDTNGNFEWYTKTVSQAMTLTAGGNLLVGKTADVLANTGCLLDNRGSFTFTRNSEVVGYINRLTSDGSLLSFLQDTTEEGTISVSGTTVSYNGGHLSRYSQTTDKTRISLLKGTVMSNLDQMAMWEKDGEPLPNEQLNCMKVSDVEGDVNVAGVFVNWDENDQVNTADMNVAMTGDMIIRIAQGVVVQRGDLLMSAGDGTAKPQGDDIIRSKTIAKVTSSHVTCTYVDGSYCVPCVLMAC